MMRISDIDFLKIQQKLKNGTQLVCFGTGRIFDRFVNNMSKMMNFCIASAVDNDHAKWGKERSFPTGSCTIYSPEHLREYIGSYILIITCADVDSIIQQIDAMKLGIEVYSYAEFMESYYVLQANKVQLPASLKRLSSPLIPKIIHYCWFGQKPLPNQYKDWMKSWKKYCPDYEIVEWNENNYDVHKNKYISGAYEAKKWAFVSDYARLDIIYEHGGIYLDTDVELIKNLDDLLYAKGFMAFELDNWIDTGLGFGAAPKLPIIGEMRDAYHMERFIDFSSRTDYLEKSRLGQIKLCTNYQTEILEKYGLERDSFKYQQIAELQIYPVPVLCGLVGSQLVLGDNTYSIHHYAASWIE